MTAYLTRIGHVFSQQWETRRTRLAVPSVETVLRTSKSWTTLKKEAPSYYKKVLPLYQSKRRPAPENWNLQKPFAS